MMMPEDPRSIAVQLSNEIEEIVLDEDEDEDEDEGSDIDPGVLFHGTADTAVARQIDLVIGWGALLPLATRNVMLRGAESGLAAWRNLHESLDELHSELSRAVDDEVLSEPYEEQSVLDEQKSVERRDAAVNLKRCLQEVSTGKLDPSSIDAVEISDWVRRSGVRRTAAFSAMYAACHRRKSTTSQLQGRKADYRTLLEALRVALELPDYSFNKGVCE